MRSEHNISVSSIQWSEISLRVSLFPKSDSKTMDLSPRFRTACPAITGIVSCGFAEAQSLDVSQTLKVSDVHWISTGSALSKRCELAVENRNTLYKTEIVQQHRSEGFSSLPPHRCKRGTPPDLQSGQALLKKEGKRSCYRFYCGFQKLELENEYFSSLRRSTPETIGREVVTKPTAQKKLTIKMNNSPSRRVRRNNKNTHLSEFNQEMGQREVLKNRIPDLPQALDFLPLLRGGAQRAEGSGTIANNNKTKHAYET
ncbi:hypothetical protein [uncultured Draconibacterium sp.]|uniref:hypothetical protein n=1 Tax=uncultured Draconibacterium sp. TaxID=1573823 RepID=UPI003217865B